MNTNKNNADDNYLLMMNKYLSKYKYLFKDHQKIVIICIVLICIQGVLGICSTLFSAYYGIDVAMVSKDINKIVTFAIIAFAFSMTCHHISIIINNI